MNALLFQLGLPEVQQANTLGSTNKVNQNLNLKTIIISLESDQAKKKNISKMGANSKQAIKRRVILEVLIPTQPWELQPGVYDQVVLDYHTETSGRFLDGPRHNMNSCLNKSKDF